MQTKSMTLATALLLGLAAGAFADQTTADPTFARQTPSGEVAAVEQATNQFYSSLNALLAGDPSGMEQVWSHGDDVTYMGPIGGIQIGWDQVREGWNVQADMKQGGHVEPMDLRVTVGSDLAIVEGYQLSSNPGGQGLPQASRIRATSSFRKENGQWKMIGHHTDLLDSLDSDSDEPSNQQPSTGSNDQPSAGPNDDSIDVSEDEVTLKLEQ